MLLTIFTPTYNRAHTLTRLFDSLINQAFKDFEWLIVDDGSTDGTAELVKSFDSNGEFPIRYIRKRNGGKHTAYNIGLEEAKGRFFFNVDSDDWLGQGSLLQIRRLADKVFSNSKCGGIIALKSYADGSIIGKEFRNEGNFQTFRDLELSNQGGERSIVFRTSVAKLFRFPVVDSEKFMTESVVYDEFRNYVFCLSNISLTICEYQESGLSSNPKMLMLKNPGGYVLYYRKRIDLAASLMERIGYVLRYNFFRHKYKGGAVSDYQGRYSLLVAMMKPFNFVVAQFYK